VRGLGGKCDEVFGEVDGIDDEKKLEGGTVAIPFVRLLEVCFESPWGF